MIHATYYILWDLGGYRLARPKQQQVSLYEKSLTHVLNVVGRAAHHYAALRRSAEDRHLQEARRPGHGRISFSK